MKTWLRRHRFDIALLLILVFLLLLTQVNWVQLDIDIAAKICERKCDHLDKKDWVECMGVCVNEVRDKSPK